MTFFQNTNVSFRCPMGLKQRMKDYALFSDLHLSEFIRTACAEKLRRETDAETAADKHLDSGHERTAD